MAWQQDLGRITLPDGTELVAGSFRGVPFRTTEAEVRVGRRNVTHEFPQRDMPFVEDLGRRARRFAVEAYVIGPNYLSERNALMEAFEAYGPGELVHPRYGVVQVALDGEVALKESPAQGGMAKFSASFVVVGPNNLTSSTHNTAPQLEAAAYAADDAAQTEFNNRFNVAGSSSLAVQAIDTWTEQAAALRTTVQRATNTEGLALAQVALSQLTSTLADVVRTPVVLVQSVRSIYLQAVLDLARPLTAFAEIGLLFDNNTRPAALLGNSVRARRVANDIASSDVQRRLALTHRSRVLALALSADAIATAHEATAMRDACLAQLDAELEQTDPSAEVARTLGTLRAALVRDVAERAEFLLRKTSYTPRTVLPALVLAQRIYQDAARSDELVLRNAVVHPAFVPVQPLEVLQ